MRVMREWSQTGDVGRSMFKSRFQRKPSDDAASRSLHGPVPHLPLEDASDRARSEGPWLAIDYRGPALILTTNVEKISSSALHRAIGRRVPDIDFGANPPAGPTKPDERPTAFGYYPDITTTLTSGLIPFLCGVSYIPHPHDNVSRSAGATSGIIIATNNRITAHTSVNRRVFSVSRI
jgi:hypothetical protein